jgi:hypothetical protein
MAFLDNSGDIILDAVLTDLGRKRMSEGNFRITQFTLGDDEVDYSLYNKNHPSGSAYYDLEILQTPVFEAFTRTNANINYGLASFNGNTNLLYLPSMKLNTKNFATAGGGRVGNAQYFAGIVYMPVNGTTTASPVSTALGAVNILAPASSTSALILETGLDTSGADKLEGTKNYQTTYIKNNSLKDTQITVRADTRIFGGVYESGGGGTAFDWQKNPSSINVSVNVNTAASGLITLNTSNSDIDDYGMATIRARSNDIYFTDANEAVQDTDVSIINGPRAVVTQVNFALQPDFSGGSRNVYYPQLGKIDQDLFSDGNTYDYIDTLVYFIGDVTGVTLQVPIRVIRKV